MKTVLKQFFVLLFVVISISLGFGCSQSESQTTLPTATLSAMLEAAEAGNWEEYVDEYYGEQHKFKSPSDRDKLVSLFREQWGTQVITGLKEASQVKPELSEDGTQASFQLSDGEYILYQNEQGNWTFHL